MDQPIDLRNALGLLCVAAALLLSLPGPKAVRAQDAEPGVPTEIDYSEGSPALFAVETDPAPGPSCSADAPKADPRQVKKFMAALRQQMLARQSARVGSGGPESGFALNSRGYNHPGLVAAPYQDPAAALPPAKPAPRDP